MSRHEVVLTLDVGGSGLKLSAYEPDRHRTALTSTSAWLPQSWSGDGLEFDVEVWWRTTVAALARFVVDLDTVVPGWTPIGITVGAIRIPFVLLDDQGQVVRPCLRNADRRATAQVAELRSRYGDEMMYGITGHWLTPEFGLPKLLWLREHERAALGRTRTVLQLHDWFVYRLSGAMCSEASSAAMSQLLAASGDAWAGELMRDLGLPDSWFPELHPAGTRIGGLRREVSAATGLPNDVPVHLGGGDTQLSALTAGATESTSRPVVVAGTTVPVQWAVPTRARADLDSYPALVSRQLTPDWWTVETNAAGVGGTLAALRHLDADLAGPALGAALAGIGLMDTPAPEGSEQLLVAVGNPVFAAQSWSDAPAAQVRGRRPEHTADDVYRAAEQGSAVAVADVLGQLTAQFGRVDSVRLTGGLAANTSWVQAVADAAAVTVAVPDHASTAGLGGASVVAGESLWVEADAEACRRYRPRREIDEAFRDGYRRLWGSHRLPTGGWTGDSACTR